jgi:Predicted nucleoside-diphosphate sugar epimerases
MEKYDQKNERVWIKIYNIEMDKIFKDKVLMITGGTGSFGNAVLKKFIESDVSEIKVFSRDEKKQDDLIRSLIMRK